MLLTGTYIDSIVRNRLTSSSYSFVLSLQLSETTRCMYYSLSAVFTVSSAEKWVLWSDQKSKLRLIFNFIWVAKMADFDFTESFSSMISWNFSCFQVFRLHSLFIRCMLLVARDPAGFLMGFKISSRNSFCWIIQSYCHRWPQGHVRNNPGWNTWLASLNDRESTLRKTFHFSIIPLRMRMLWRNGHTYVSPNTWRERLFVHTCTDRLGEGKKEEKRERAEEA